MLHTLRFSGQFPGRVPMREPLLTERLLIRDVTEADAELMFHLDSDPNVMRYQAFDGDGVS